MPIKKKTFKTFHFSFLLKKKKKVSNSLQVIKTIIMIRGF